MSLIEADACQEQANCNCCEEQYSYETAYSSLQRRALVDALNARSHDLPVNGFFARKYNANPALTGQHSRAGKRPVNIINPRLRTPDLPWSLKSEVCKHSPKVWGDLAGISGFVQLRSMMIASLPETPSLSEQVQSLLATGECPRNEVAELQQENSDLRQQVRELRCDVGYWKSRHADAVKRIVILQAELDQAKAEIRRVLFLVKTTSRKKGLGSGVLEICATKRGSGVKTAQPKWQFGGVTRPLKSRPGNH